MHPPLNLARAAQRRGSGHIGTIPAVRALVKAPRTIRPMMTSAGLRRRIRFAGPHRACRVRRVACATWGLAVPRATLKVRRVAYRHAVFGTHVGHVGLPGLGVTSRRA